MSTRVVVCPRLVPVCRGPVCRGPVRRGPVRRGLVRRGLVCRGLVCRGLVRALAALALIAPLGVPAVALAADVQIPIQAALRTNSGGPATDGKYVVFAALYDAPDAQQPVWSDVYSSAEVSGGLMGLVLGDGDNTTLDSGVFAAGVALWVGIKVGAEPELPRVPLGRVPFAVRADVATLAESVACQGCIGGAALAPGSIDAVSIADGAIPASKLIGGQGSGLDADKLDGLTSDDFVLKTDAVTSAYAVHGEAAVASNVPARVFLRHVGAQPAKKVLLDVWGRKGIVPGGLTRSFSFGTDVDFAAGLLDGASQSGQGSAAILTVPGGFGDGSDGALSVPSGTATPNDVNRKVTSAAAGSTQVNVADASGLSAGDRALVWQVAGANAGAHLMTTVVEVVGTVVTVADPMPAAFSSAAGARAQLVRVPQYTTVQVAAGATLQAPAWDGDVGGVLAFVAQGAVTIAGAVQVKGRGFRGTSHGGIYRNQTGVQGEGSGGVGVAKAQSPNGSGGAGGGGLQDAGSGGGGGHATSGATAGVYAGKEGPGGEAVGDPTLGTLHFGGAGGEGGADEDGAYPGGGGNGGGVVWFEAPAIDISGQIDARGDNGKAGCQSCGGKGSGMGSGGGGAGGSVKLVASTLTVSGTVDASGGSGGSKCSGCTSIGGAGSDGRVLFAADSVQLDGSSAPAAQEIAAPVGAASGSWASAVIDTGYLGASVDSVGWVANVPAAATITVQARASDVPFAKDAPAGQGQAPAWVDVVSSGQGAAATGQFQQLRVVMAGTATATPNIDSFELVARSVTQLGGLPSALTLSIGGQSVPLKVADPPIDGAHIIEELDVTGAYNAAQGAAGGIVQLQLGSATDGRYQWHVFVER